MLQNKIRSVRKAAKITQGELAEKLGINRATVSKYENGEISLSVEMLRRIADILHVDWTELIPQENQTEITVKYPGIPFVIDEKSIYATTQVTSSNEQILHDMTIYEIQHTCTQLNIDGRLKAEEYFKSYLINHLSTEELRKIATWLADLATTPQYQQYSNEPKSKEEGDNG